MTGPHLPARRLVLVGLWLPLLQACSTLLPSPPKGENWTHGRMLLRVDASNSQVAQSFTAAFELQGDSTTGELRLLTPLGTRLATAQWAPGRVRLVSLNAEQSFSSLDELSQQVLGQTVPLAALPDWLAGQPWRAARHLPQPQGFEQLGWQVLTAERAQGLIEARRPAAGASPAVLLRVRLESPA